MRGRVYQPPSKHGTTWHVFLNYNLMNHGLSFFFVIYTKPMGRPGLLETLGATVSWSSFVSASSRGLTSEMMFAVEMVHRARAMQDLEEEGGFFGF